MKLQIKIDLERPSVIKRLWIFLYIVCGLTLIPELFLQREPHFPFAGIWGFYAFLGFVSCALLILISKLMGLFLKKDEDYYQKKKSSILGGGEDSDSG